MGLVGTAPQGDAGMVAQTAHLVTGIADEGIGFGHIIVGHIEPEVIPHHDALLVAVVIELIIGDTACPQTDHVVVQVTVQPYLRLVLLTMTA